jgi:hypothetical protein
VSAAAAASLWAWRLAIESPLASLMVSPKVLRLVSLKALRLVSLKVSPWALRSVMAWASELPRLHRRSPSTPAV